VTILTEATVETCPVCSEEVEELVHCSGCAFDDRAAALRARCRLDAYRRSAGDNAYFPTGCRVCPECARQFAPQCRQCPLAIFYHGLAGAVSRGGDRSGVREMEDAIDYWAACLEERGFPEHIEGFWRRMVDWLVYEVKRR
jgi:hypothetical protein